MSVSSLYSLILACLAAFSLLYVFVFIRNFYIKKVQRQALAKEWQGKHEKLSLLRDSIELGLVKSQPYYELVTKIPELFFIFNETGIIFVNGFVKSVLGYEPEDLIGKKWSDLLYQEDFQSLKQKSNTAVVSPYTGARLRCKHIGGYCVELTWCVSGWDNGRRFASARPAAGEW